MQIPKPHRFLILKVFLCLLLFQLICLNTILANQNGKQKITIIATNITVQSLLKQIEKQTGMRFMYSVDAIDVNEKINANFSNVSLDDLLSNLFKNKGIIWQYREGIISLKLQNKHDLDNNVEELRFKDISGKILDEKGIPIPGVTILIKGTRNGTQTDSDGQFSLSGVNEGGILIMSSIGYEKKEVVISNNSYILVSLKSASGLLDETVVIAYGTAIKRNLVGNVATVKAEEIGRSPVPNVLMALQGRVPGIFINQNIGMSGAGITTMIQGQNSLTQGNDPFYVIDGVPFTSQLLPNFGTVLGKSGVNLAATSGNPMTYINPSDIESVTILKDADATAIYGSRAANGAILITTKKGKSGDLKVDLNIQNGWQWVARELKMLNGKQFLEMRHEAIANDGLSVKTSDYDINGWWDTTRSTNWQKVLIGNTANYTNVNTSLSGGTNLIQYLAGVTYHKETTVFPTKLGDQKVGFHLNLNSHSSNDRFNFQVSLNYVLDNNKIPNADLTPQAISLSPTAPTLYNKDGTLNWSTRPSGATSFFNPLASLLKIYSNNTSNIISNVTLQYNILKGLNVNTSLGYNNLQTNELIVNPLIAFDPLTRQTAERAGYFGNNKMNSWIIEPQVNYRNQLEFHKFDILLGTTIQQSSSNGALTYGSGYISDDIIGDILSAATTGVISSTISKYKYNALFARFNYSLKDKYILNLTSRRDGSSRFGPSNRFHNFWSVGGGWIFSEERVVKNTIPFLSFGKLRASYGTTGNDQIGDYTFLNRYLPVPVGVPYRGNVGIAPNGIYNPFLQWEETKKLNVGIDVGFLKDKILLNVSHNVNRSSNLLKYQPLPYATGFYNVLINFPGTIQNTGWEFTINSTNIHSKNVIWKTSINLTIPNNKLIAYPGLENSSDAGYLFIGKSLSTAAVFHYLGVDPATGKYQFADNKGSATFNPNFNTDRTVFVNTSPIYYGGFTNELSYKNFSLNILIQFTKRNGLNSNFGYYLPGIRNVNQPVEVLKRWKKVGDNASIQRFNSDQSLGTTFGLTNSSDGALKDASYLRFKNVELSWRMPSQWAKKIRVKDLTIFMQGQNIFTITNYVGLDPETVGANVLPPLRNFVLGGHLSL